MSTLGGWPQDWRDTFWRNHDPDFCWDVVVIGGGISGAGVLREAVRLGLSAVLIEKGDFASGTSSRSSKLVHGGLRYLATGDWRLTLESVRERQKLLKEAPGLIQPQRFLIPIYRNQKPRSWEMRAGLSLYDLFARKKLCYQLSADDTRRFNPGLNTDGLESGYSFQDADTDDVRLVMRVLRDAQSHNGHALNYVEVQNLVRENGKVCGATVKDRVRDTTYRLRCKAVINAAGVWAENFTQSGSSPHKIRPLRGSHLLVPAWRFPLGQGISWQHHDDGRNVFAYPWANVALVGTTDLDHSDNLNNEPRHTPEEARYLIDAVNRRFPNLKLRPSDVISTYAGVRPVISSGQDDPSAESRESALWVEPGLVSLSGGKLTTFAVAARECLQAAAPFLGIPAPKLAGNRILDPVEFIAGDARLSVPNSTRLGAMYGSDFPNILHQTASASAFDTIGPTPHHWVELIEAARHEAVEHLDDLLLRRTRLGILTAHGAQQYLPRIQELCQDVLGWSDNRWQDEEQRYREIWNRSYAPPI